MKFRARVRMKPCGEHGIPCAGLWTAGGRCRSLSAARARKTKCGKGDKCYAGEKMFWKALRSLRKRSPETKMTVNFLAGGKDNPEEFATIVAED